MKKKTNHTSEHAVAFKPHKRRPRPDRDRDLRSPHSAHSHRRSHYHHLRADHITRCPRIVRACMIIFIHDHDKIIHYTFSFVVVAELSPTPPLPPSSFECVYNKINLSTYSPPAQCSAHHQSAFVARTLGRCVETLLRTFCACVHFVATEFSPTHARIAHPHICC